MKSTPALGGRQRTRPTSRYQQRSILYPQLAVNSIVPTEMAAVRTTYAPYFSYTCSVYMPGPFIQRQPFFDTLAIIKQKQNDPMISFARKEPGSSPSLEKNGIYTPHSTVMMDFIQMKTHKQFIATRTAAPTPTPARKRNKKKVYILNQYERTSEQCVYTKKNPHAIENK